MKLSLLKVGTKEDETDSLESRILEKIFQLCHKARTLSWASFKALS